MSSKYETFIMILKPDAIDRRLFGKILARFEEAGFDIIDLKYGPFPDNVWMLHYNEHLGKPHFEPLCRRMANKDVAVFHLGGQRGIERARRMIGATDALEAAPGTIRGDFGNYTGVIADNLVHISDSEVSAKREWNVWFGENDGE